MNAKQFFSLTGYAFDNQALLQQALTHRSHSRSANNERLEFLGDSILNQIIANYVYHRFESSDEGELSRIRASLVNAETLAEVARSLNLGDAILLGSGELKSGGHRRSSILSDALEAVIAAVYLDSDFEQTEQMVLRIYQSRLQNLSPGANLKDPKTRLQEYLQAKAMELPDYQLVKTSGKSHDQLFTVRCQLVGQRISATGEGGSRKKAEQQAAERVLGQLKL